MGDGEREGCWRPETVQNSGEVEAVEEQKAAPETQGSAGLFIADEVVAIIAGMAAIEVPGVAGMSGGLVEGISERLGLRSLQKGVKVEVGEKEAALDMFLVVEYGARIPEVAEGVRSAVRQAVETMTGLKVIESNVYVQGVTFAKEREQPKEQ